MKIHIYGNHLFYSQSIAKNLISFPEIDKKITLKINTRFEQGIMDHKKGDVVLFLESSSFEFKKEWLNKNTNGGVYIVLITENIGTIDFQDHLITGLKFAITATDSDLVFRDVILAVLNGSPSYYSREVLNHILNQKNGPVDFSKNKISFSSKEVKLINLFWEEKNKHSIAEEMNISVRTVESYRSKLITRLNTTSFLGVVKTALDQGVIVI